MLSGDHWLELFRLVKLPKGTTLERLTFGDLLSVQSNIVENVEQLKNLNARAQGTRVILDSFNHRCRVKPCKTTKISFVISPQNGIFTSRLPHFSRFSFLLSHSALIKVHIIWWNLNLRKKFSGEVTIREAIQELEVWAAQASFSLTEYKHSNGSTMKIIKDWKDAINQVKDNQALLQSLKNSPYYSQFKDQTSIWEKRITDLDVFLQSINEIQRKWVYLEPIFGRGALPSEASRFNRVDVEFRVILQDIAKDSRLVALCNRQSLGRTLEQLVDQLNRYNFYITKISIFF